VVRTPRSGSKATVGHHSSGRGGGQTHIGRFFPLLPDGSSRDSDTPSLAQHHAHMAVGSTSMQQPSCQQHQQQQQQSPQQQQQQQQQQPPPQAAASGCLAGRGEAAATTQQQQHQHQQAQQQQVESLQQRHHQEIEQLRQDARCVLCAVCLSVCLCCCTPEHLRISTPATYLQPSMHYETQCYKLSAAALCCV
jgi:mannitol-specific phosphotransferase system IIBC component